ncbi:hypothetical protein BDN70DRAFT_816843, partial [Pholiota conissans]
LSDIRKCVQEAFGVRLCIWQLKVIEVLLRRDADIVSIAGTGMGKTITFYAILAFKAKGSVQIIVTPLNILGKQNVACLEKAEE